MPGLREETVRGLVMTDGAASGVVSRRGFLRSLIAACLAGGRKRAPLRKLDDASVRRMATWVG